MLFAKDFRKIARESLRGKWILAVLVCLVASFLGANPVFSSNGGSVNLNFDEDSFGTIQSGSHSGAIQGGVFNDALWGIILPIVTGIMVVAVIYIIAVMIIGGAVTLGLCKFNLGLVDKKNPQFMDLFSGFDRFGAGFCVQFLRGLFTFLWSLLFVIPGIVASYRYAMAAYILAEHPDMTASEAIDASKQMMAGNKWRLFCLEFSFIGWDILCIFTLGIGNLVLRPYKETAYAAFYREISGTWERIREEIPNEPQEEEPRVYYHEV